MSKATVARLALARTPRALRAAVAGLVFACIACVHGKALADDPCEGPGAEVKQLVGVLNGATASNRKPGVFRVASERPIKGAQRFRTMYVIDGKPIYTGALEQKSDVSDGLTIQVSKRAADALELSYVSGGGGAISCNYRISRSGDRFAAAKTK